MEAGPRRSLVQRMMGASRLEIGVYEEVEHDTTATSQAAAVVVIVAVCAAIGGVGQEGGGGIIVGPIAALLRWLVWAAVTYLIGTRLFAGTATWGELLRTIGFAQSPGVLLVLGFVPLLGWVVSVGVGIWMLVAVVIAIRQALDFTTGKAVLTALLGWLAFVVVGLVVATLFGVGFGAVM